MSDFLGRLAERALGLTPSVRPVIASQYAPDPTSAPAEDWPLEQTLEVDAPASEMLHPPAKASIPSASEQSSMEKPTGERITRPLPISEEPPARRLSGEQVMNSVSSIPAPPEISLPAQLQADSVPSSIPELAPSVAREDEPTPVTRAIPRVRVEITSRRPTVEAAPTAELLSENRTAMLPAPPVKDHATTITQLSPDQPRAPTIKVTIGRIEVRAVTPPPPARPPGTKSRPALSLDDYLSRRNEGAR